MFEYTKWILSCARFLLSVCVWVRSSVRWYGIRISHALLHLGGAQFFFCVASFFLHRNYYFKTFHAVREKKEKKMRRKWQRTKRANGVMGLSNLLHGMLCLLYKLKKFGIFRLDLGKNTVADVIHPFLSLSYFLSVAHTFNRSPSLSFSFSIRVRQHCDLWHITNYVFGIFCRKLFSGLRKW